MAIHFVSHNIDFKLTNPSKIIKWIEESVRREQKTIGDITFNFVDDKTIRELNISHLNHDYPTDIITFDYSFLNTLNSDIYISIETVFSNAKEHENGIFERELYRNLIHGILHLIGYQDKTVEEFNFMKSKEEFYLNYLDKF